MIALMSKNRIGSGILFGIIIFLAPYVAQGADLCATGFSPSSYNGTWVDTGTYGGQPYYLLSGVYLFYSSQGYTDYGMDGSLGSAPGGWDFYHTGTGGPTGGYTDNVGGQTAGTIASGACGGTPTTTPTTTVYTVDNPNQDYFNLVLLLLIGMIFPIWLFKKR